MNQDFEIDGRKIEIQRVNIDCGNQDKQALHGLSTMQIREQEFSADVSVFDPKNIFITSAADHLMARMYILPGFVVRDYAIHFQESLIKRLAKGKHAGCILISKSANWWIAPQSESREICAMRFTINIVENYTTALCICSWQELLDHGQNAPAPDSISTLRRLVTDLLSGP